MRGRNKILIVGGVLLAVVGAVKLTSQAADLTLDDAEREARRFLQKVGLPADQPVKSAGQAGTNWELVLGGCRLSLDIRTGKPTGLANLNRAGENEDAQRRDRAKRFADRASAEAFVRSLAGRIGVPAEWKLESVELGDEVRARFAEHPFGYPYLSTGIANFAQFSLDSRDEVLTGASLRWDIVPEPPRLRVSREKAVAVADAALRQRGNRVLPTRPATVRLGYALSSRLPLSFHQNPHARLVWEVMLGTDAVWVDAETGVIISAPRQR